VKLGCLPIIFILTAKTHIIHKSQGMTVGPNQPFEKVIIYYPVEPGRQNTPGLELVATSRAMSIECFAVGNPVQDLTYKYIQSIGNTPAYGNENCSLLTLNKGLFILNKQQRNASRHWIQLLILIRHMRVALSFSCNGMTLFAHSINK
jgi:hypothetical protein